MANPRVNAYPVVRAVLIGRARRVLIATKEKCTPAHLETANRTSWDAFVAVALCVAATGALLVQHAVELADGAREDGA